MSSSFPCPWISRRSRGAHSTGCPSLATTRGRKRPGRKRESLRRVSPGSCIERLGSLPTPPTAIILRSTRLLASRHTSRWARSTLARCSPISGPTTTLFVASWRGVSSMPRCSTTGRRRLVRASNHTWKGCGTTTARPQTVDSPPGRQVAPASRWSTPGCDSCAAEGWMHNRLRMITASFLVKDLHIDWTRGARHFMVNLIDGDLASNQHNWQWVAGTRDRCRAVLQDLQPREPKPEVRSEWRLHPAMGARALTPAER